MTFQPKNKQEEKILKLIEESTKIKSFINDCNTPSKKNNYGYLRDFYININKNPDTHIINPLEINNRKDELLYIKSIKEEIINHCNYLRDEYISPIHKTHKTPSPKAFASRTNAIKQFLLKYDIDIKNYFWKITIKRKYYPNTDSIGEKVTPTKKQLKSILNICNTQYKAIFLLQMVTGSRIGEILKLTFDDIRTDEKYPFAYIIIRHTGSKNKRYCEKPITPEAKEYYDLYLKQRDKYIQESYWRTKNLKLKNHKKTFANIIFPITIGTAEDYWEKQINKLGLLRKDPITNHITMGTKILSRHI